MNFILGKNNISIHKQKDLFVLNKVVEETKYKTATIVSNYVIYIMAIVNYEEFENKPNNYSIVPVTAQNRTAVKTLHKNSKGTYFNSAKTKSRVYLTKEEEKELSEYILQYFI